MTRHGPVLLALSVLAIAGWTYSVNYDTRAALDRLSDLRARIAEEREALQVLRVEWAFLNTPDRLARLVVNLNDRLGLMALTPEALGIVAAVPYPKDTPMRPMPGWGTETMIAAAPPAQADTGALAPVEPEGEDRNWGSAVIDGGPLVVASAEAGTMPGGRFGADTGPVATVMAASADAGVQPAAVLASAEPAALKAEVLGADATALSMEEAVALALAEAGVIDAKMGAATVMPASTAGIPMPQARPAAWVRQ